MNREEVIKMLGADWSRYEALVGEGLRSDNDLLNRLNSSILSNSGKQLRPMLSLLIGRICGGVNDDTLHCAAATEMLHNATLIHDDVADESSLRRGRPTLSALIGPSSAVLVGDFWLSRAVGMIIGTGHQDQVILLMARTLSDLAEGEMLQLQKASSADTTEEDYMRIVYCKTASLFESACLSAAICADAPQELVDAAGRYARATGIAFQIRDDIFDYWDEANIGKPVGIDLKEQKITMPMLGALRNVSDPGRYRDMVRQIPDRPGYCDELHRFVLDNGGVEYATGRLDVFINEALEALELFPPSEEREVLAMLARYNAIRKK